MTEGERDDGPTPLDPEDVTHLSFEGGGGKGLAYFGAMAALAEVGVLKKVSRPRIPGGKPVDDYVLGDNVEGVAGASAGAITASLVASDLGIRRLFEAMTDASVLQRFYDKAEMDVDVDPLVSTGPVRTVTYDGTELYGVKKRTRKDGHKQLWSGVPLVALSTLFRSQAEFLQRYTPPPSTGPASVPISVLSKAGQALLQAFSAMTHPKTYSAIVDYVGTSLHGALKQRVPQLNTSAATALFGSLSAYLLNFKEDYGAFSGAYARSYMTLRIAEGTGLRQARKTPSQQWSVTDIDEFAENYTGIDFQTHRMVHGTKLKVTGTNLTTGESVYFGADTTPRLDVADAVRISMGFPLAFKPVVLERKHIPKLTTRRGGTTKRGGKAAADYAGHWVDGGALNNNPIHAFDSTPGVIEPGMLGLRLGRDTPNRIASVGGLVGALGASITGLSERGEIRTEQEAAQTVTIPVEKLQTLDFVPSDADRDTDMLGAAAAVLEYFGSDASPETVVREKLGLETLAAS